VRGGWGGGVRLHLRKRKNLFGGKMRHSRNKAKSEGGMSETEKQKISVVTRKRRGDNSLGNRRVGNRAVAQPRSVRRTRVKKKWSPNDRRALRDRRVITVPTLYHKRGEKGGGDQSAGGTVSMRQALRIRRGNHKGRQPQSEQGNTISSFQRFEWGEAKFSSTGPSGAPAGEK